MRSFSFMLLMLALAGSAAAQESEPPGPALSDAELIRWAAQEVGTTHVHVVPPPPDSYTSQSDATLRLQVIDNPDRDLERIGAEIGGGALGMLIGGGLGTLLLWATSQGSVAAQVMMIVAGAGGSLAALGVTGGVTLAGDLMGARGNFGYAFIGQAAGALAAIPLVVTAFERGDPWLSLVPIGMLPLIGAVTAYELAHLTNAGTPGNTIAFVTPAPGGAVAEVESVF